MTKPVIVFHDSCPDGWGAAWWLGKHLGPHVKVPGRYNEPVNDELLAECAGAEVFLVDFCYPPEQTQRIMQASSRLTVLDHHQTADEWLAGWGRTDANTAALTTWMDAHAIVIDQERSGCGLVAEYVASRWGIPAPRFLANIEDRDLWRFGLAETRDVFAAVTSRPYTEAAWDEMREVGVWELENEGRAINRYRDQLIEQVAASWIDLAIGKWIVPVASSPYAIGSDVAGKLAAQSPNGIGGYMIAHSDHVQIGLRSTPAGPDVAELAAFYGGGGHKHASGLRLDWRAFEKERWAGHQWRMDVEAAAQRDA